MDFQTLKWLGGTDGFLQLIDQRKLPAEYVTIDCRAIEDVWQAIKTLAVRGAPAIGVTAAYGVLLGLQTVAGYDLAQALARLDECCQYLASSRPTAVNLFAALARMRNRGTQYAAQPSADTEGLRNIVLAEADFICAEDIDMCRRIGENGAKFIAQNSRILTHCNAGALATAGQGTALSLMFEAHRLGTSFTVYVDETRPLLQGSRLTAWELKQAAIDTILICDNMAGALMKEGKIDAVITGADRIAANGDTANKIGTYSLSVLAKAHNIPFYIAAPTTTFDLSIASGNDIPVEQRDPAEVRRLAGLPTAPQDVAVYNPAFDVTPAQNISVIITEKGVIDRPDALKISTHLK
jgi:methylthioribose-1-phosphate isomerase